jgi:hypothetical protein
MQLRPHVAECTVLDAKAGNARRSTLVLPPFSSSARCTGHRETSHFYQRIRFFLRLFTAQSMASRGSKPGCLATRWRQLAAIGFLTLVAVSLSEAKRHGGTIPRRQLGEREAFDHNDMLGDGAVESARSRWVRCPRVAPSSATYCAHSNTMRLACEYSVGGVRAIVST